MDRLRLHGTDGIRGRIEAFSGSDEETLVALVERRVLSERAMRIIGEATGLHLGATVGDSPLVMIGWDRRDGNAALVDALASGLSVAGCRVVRIGEVPTPGLHHAVLASIADAGMMITASHNPATDSGVKLFDSEGRKSMPEAEDLVSTLAWELADGSRVAPQSQPEDEQDLDGLRLYRSALDKRLRGFELLFDLDFQSVDWTGIIPSQGLLLDCSGGSATEWLAEGIYRRGLDTIEVSSRNDPINHNCGAGGLSPTSTWSNTELLMEESSHRLLWTLSQRLDINDGMAPWAEGEIVGAALDGDGDRCLLIEATSDGLRVVDGDRMCDDIMRAAIAVEDRPWRMAASIESDLGLTADLQRLGPTHEAMTTAVGDRWLTAALSPLTAQNRVPALIGTEDSGHLVLPAPWPGRRSHWSLVGDGAATLLGVLLARARLSRSDSSKPFENGWKKRLSIQPSERSRWTGDNALADLVHNTAQEWCGSELERVSLAGEPALLLLSGTLQDHPISIAVRNSGTEAKTAISVRFAAGIHADGESLIAALEAVLAPHLKP
jgi:phosphoglucosamine mutase